MIFMTHSNFWTNLFCSFEKLEINFLTSLKIDKTFSYGVDIIFEDKNCDDEGLIFADVYVFELLIFIFIKNYYILL